jgi:hypothetical protein
VRKNTALALAAWPLVMIGMLVLIPAAVFAALQYFFSDGTLE